MAIIDTLGSQRPRSGRMANCRESCSFRLVQATGRFWKYPPRRTTARSNTEPESQSSSPSMGKERERCGMKMEVRTR